MKIRNRNRALAAITLGAFAALPAAGAYADDTSAEIRLLKERLKQLEAKVAKQDREQRETKAEAHHATNIANAAVQGNGHIVCKDAACPPAPPPVFVTFKNGLFVETEDHAYSFKVGGRILVDGGGISTPLNGYSGQAGFRQARLEIEGKAAWIWFYKFQYDFANTTTGQWGANELTAAYPYVSATNTTANPLYKYYTNSNYVQQGFRDVYVGLQYPELSAPWLAQPVFFKIGSQYEPFSLESMNSSKYRDFIERPMAVEAFSPSRHVGASVGMFGKDNWTAQLGVYTFSFEDMNYTPAAGQAGQYGVVKLNGNSWYNATGGGNYLDVTSRVTYAPISDEHNLLHLGVSGRYHQPNSSTGLNDDRVMELGNRIGSEANILGQKLLGTTDLSCGTLGVPVAGTYVAPPGGAYGTSSISGNCVKNVETLDFELAAAYKNFFLQGEYISTWYTRDSNRILQAAISQSAGYGGSFLVPGNSSAQFNGYYVQGEYWITGEEKAASYEMKDKAAPATFSQLKIKNPLSAGGWGAWGLAGRWSSIDLNNGPYTGSHLYNALYVAQLAKNVPVQNYVANSGIYGGFQQNLTGAINWYPDTGFALQANVTRVMSAAAPLNWNGGQSYSSGSHSTLFELRAKAYW